MVLDGKSGRDGSDTTARYGSGEGDGDALSKSKHGNASSKRCARRYGKNIVVEVIVIARRRNSNAQRIVPMCECVVRSSDASKSVAECWCRVA